MQGRAVGYAWMNGQFIPWDEAKIHVATGCVSLGSRVFEGIRAYWSESQEELHIFKSGRHLRRLYQSAKIMRMSPRLTAAQLERILVELLVKNNCREDVHLVPAIYFGVGQEIMSYRASEIDTGIYVICRPLKSQLRSGSGVRACVSSWTRISDRDMPPRIKVSANYQNARLAAVQAREDGYDDAILLNDRGKVAEGPAACLFIVREAVAITPPVTGGILESVTRETVIQLFEQELSVPVVEREVDRTELYIADEIFYCGSALEIAPILAVDKYAVGDGKIGEITARLQQAYERVVRGEEPGYAEWLLPVYRSLRDT